MLSLLVVSLKSTPLSNVAVIFVPVSSGNYRSTINFKSYIYIQMVVAKFNQQSAPIKEDSFYPNAGECVTPQMRFHKRSIEPLLTHVLFNGTWPER